MRHGIWTLLPLLVLASCTALEIGRPADWPETNTRAGRSCMESPYVRAVLRSVKDRVLHQWRLPGGIAANETVVLGFILDANGRVVRSAVFEASNRALAYSALHAIDGSEPFDIPADAMCLAGVPFVARFTNPVHR